MHARESVATQQWHAQNSSNVFCDGVPLFGEGNGVLQLHLIRGYHWNSPGIYIMEVVLIALTSADSRYPVFIEMILFFTWGLYLYILMVQ